MIIAMMPSLLETTSVNPLLRPWYNSLEEPITAQEGTLNKLLDLYSKSDYGDRYSAQDIGGVEEYRENFPLLNYERLKDLLEPVKRGDYQAFLPETPEVWVMTRGTTGTPKILPATKLHLQQIFSCGARAFVNHVERSGGVIEGKILNLSMPSRVAKIHIEKETIKYGYSSGTYSRLFPSIGEAMLVPTQDEIDSLGPGITKKDWENRFDLVYRKVAGEEVTVVIGVAPVIISFARFLKKVHGRLPRDLWDIRTIICTSVRKIQTRYVPLYRKYFGEVSVVEIYSATEGVFAQQLDSLPYLCPNYDTHLFEVSTGSGFKMLYELERGEWGRLVISTCMFPRYEIGDMIESMGKNYFRVFGRAKASHILEHRLYRLLYKWFL